MANILHVVQENVSSTYNKKKLIYKEISGREIYKIDFSFFCICFNPNFFFKFYIC